MVLLLEKLRGLLKKLAVVVAVRPAMQARAAVRIPPERVAAGGRCQTRRGTCQRRGALSGRWARRKGLGFLLLQGKMMEMVVLLRMMAEEEEEEEEPPSRDHLQTGQIELAFEVP